MIITKKHLSRRTALKGMGVTMALPFLEAMVPARTPLADVDSSFNAVVADAGDAGPFFFEGRGAGQGPTASAVVSDLVDVARGAFGSAFGRPARQLTVAGPVPANARASASGWKG